MKRKYFLFSLPILAALIFCLADLENMAEAKSMEINVKSSAQTGGNTVSDSGSVKTGDAKAESLVKTEINSEGNSEVKINAEAEANGEKVEINAESKGEDTDIHEEKSKNGADVKADLEMSRESNAGNGNVGQEKGIINSVKEKFNSFIDKVISLFS